MIANDFEDKRVQDCFNEISKVFAGYSLQQQNAANEFEKNIIEPLRAFRKKFSIASNDIKKKGEMV